MQTLLSPVFQYCLSHLVKIPVSNGLIVHDPFLISFEGFRYR